MSDMESPGNPGGKVSQRTFMNVTYAFTALSLIFVIFRVAVRAKCFGRVFADDFLVALGWIMLLVTCVTWQAEAPALWEQFAIARGEDGDGNGLDSLPRFQRFLRMNVPWLYLFYSCLWSIKLSFLIFFRRIGGTSRKGHRVWWWCVLVVTVLAWIPCVADIDYNCTTKSILYILRKCSSAASIRFQYRTLIVNCVLDVFTDLLIMTIPVFLLWNVRITPRKRFILFSLFCATILVIVVAIVRVAVVNSPDQPSDMSWLYLWCNVEMGAAVMVACVASFRQFFTTAQSPPSRSEYPSARSTPAPAPLLIPINTPYHPHNNRGVSFCWHSTNTASGPKYLVPNVSEKVSSHHRKTSSTSTTSTRSIDAGTIFSWRSTTTSKTAAAAPPRRWPEGERPPISWPRAVSTDETRAHAAVGASQAALDETAMWTGGWNATPKLPPPPRPARPASPGGTATPPRFSFAHR